MSLPFRCLKAHQRANLLAGAPHQKSPSWSTDQAVTLRPIEDMTELRIMVLAAPQ
jgi:hypothetical protein